MGLAAMDFFQTSDNPTVLELFMSRIFTEIEKTVEDGAWLYYAGDEIVLRVATRRNLPNGECIMYYPDGSPALIGHFRDGDRSGEWKYFRPDGSPWVGLSHH